MPLADLVNRYLGGMTPGSQELDPQARESLARAAMLQFGTGLLSGSSAPPGDLGAVLGTSLARGADVYAQGVGSELDRAREQRLDVSDEAYREETLGLARNQDVRAQARADQEAILTKLQMADAETQARVRENLKSGIMKQPEIAERIQGMGITDPSMIPDEIADAILIGMGDTVAREVFPEAMNELEKAELALRGRQVSVSERGAAVDERRMSLQERLAVEAPSEPPMPPGGLYQATRGNFQGPAVSPEEVISAAGLPPAFLATGKNREEVAKLIRRYGPEGAKSLIREEYEKRLTRRRPER